MQGADLIFGTSGIIKFDYVASYRCHFGTLIGASDIVCTEDGTWSPEAPRCEGKQKAIHITLPVLYTRERVIHSISFCFLICCIYKYILYIEVACSIM